MKMIGYARVVPDANGQEALVHQKARLQGFCQEHGHELSDYLQEQVSGDFSYGDRPELSKAIEKLNSECALLVVRLDKLSSNKTVLKEIFTACEKRGSQIIVVQGPTKLEEMTSSLQVTHNPD
jgi:DNA invertase Pin-like site-specific DNA recombinase